MLLLNLWPIRSQAQPETQEPLDDSHAFPAWGISAVIHAVLIILLALWTFTQSGPQGPLGLESSAPSQGEPDLTDLEECLPSAASSAEVLEETVEVPLNLDPFLPESEHGEKPQQQESTQVTSASVFAVPESIFEVDSLRSRQAGGFEGRNPERKKQLLAQEGGNAQSEAAVARALEWLRIHQLENGSWLFDHRKGHCKGRCRNPGTVGSSTGSTALGVLPFLGAGHTHEKGKYQEVVNRALYYLVTRARRANKGLDLQEGTMYSHGLASIAFCEDYALTRDQVIGNVAQETLRFIVAAQEPHGGGWRYKPGQPGDTSMHGWQLMALRSGEMAYLEVPERTMHKADYFLNSVMSDQGRVYKYMPGSKEETAALTAIGILCRMYMGYPRDSHMIEVGVKHIARIGPSKDDMYYNYYATQVMHHYGGQLWFNWNVKMRDYLIDTQARNGHENGSWYFKGNNGHVGGRLYNTAMAAMTLEVYYRHLPLYHREAIHARD